MKCLERKVQTILCPALGLIAVLSALLLTSSSAWANEMPAQVMIGGRTWTEALNGPWKFRLGDNLRWAEPGYNDEAWDDVDLTPTPGSHDPDVGLSGYVPGWAGDHYPNQIGYAWYRMRIQYSGGERLFLLGPVLVDNAYQVYLNGSLLGGIGNFSADPPRAYGVHPKLFALPPIGPTDVIAIRVWRAPIDLADRNGGGMHIAPVLGNAEGIRPAYVMQWWERIRGELPELIPIAIFSCIAIIALELARFSWRGSALMWLAASLILTSLIRGNLVMFWCSGIESISTFELISGVLLLPATLGAWLVTSYKLFGIGGFNRIPPLVGGLIGLYSICEVFTRSWSYGVVPRSVVAVAQMTIVYDRYALLVLFVFIVVVGTSTQPRESLYTLPGILAIGVGQFASELSRLGVPGIWFPFDTGVSLANYAYIIAGPLFLFLLLHDASEIGAVLSLFEKRSLQGESI